MTRNALVALSCSSDQGKGVGGRMEWKALGVTVGGTGEKTGENAVKRESSKGRFSRKDSLNCGSLAMAVQRGSAMAVIEGYDRALHVALAQSFANTKRRMKAEDIGPEETASSTQTTDEQEDSGQEEKENNGEEE